MSLLYPNEEKGSRLYLCFLSVRVSLVEVHARVHEKPLVVNTWVKASIRGTGTAGDSSARPTQGRPRATPRFTVALDGGAEGGALIKGRSTKVRQGVWYRYATLPLCTFDPDRRRRHLLHSDRLVFEAEGSFCYFADEG